MKDKFQIRLFAHSFVSDWNHGNAHFLRGLAREMMALGHEVLCYEELGGWSLANMVASEEAAAPAAIDQFRAALPMLDVRFYSEEEGLQAFLQHELRNADIVLVHEWNKPSVVHRILEWKRQY